MKQLIGMIADHPTPKINAEDGIAYNLNSRDYKGVMIVVLQECNLFSRIRDTTIEQDEEHRIL